MREEGTGGTGATDRGTGGPVSADPPMDRITRVILIGFMAAGKTTAGRLLAERLGWRFVDFDEEIARRCGQTVPEIFRDHGESVFRAMESRLWDELRSAERTVFAPGGGWVTTPTALEALPPATMLVWLRVTPEEAVRRATAGGGVRPLLAGPDPLQRARTLLNEREALYRRAHMTIDVDGLTPDDVAREIAARLAEERLQA